MVSSNDSPCMVLTITGLFIISLTLITSGTIIIYQQRQEEFITAASFFLVIGMVLLLICMFVQRYELLEYLRELHQDMYLLKHREQSTDRTQQLIAH